MDKKIKVALYISGAILGLIIIVFIYNSFFNNQFNSEIPEVSDSQTLSLPVKEQISGAFAKAQNDPSAENLGMLGMVYHSSANYELAAQCYKLAINRKKSGWIWNYYLGYLSMEMGESDAVIENFKRVLKKNPKIDLAWYYIGEEYKNQRKNKLAEETFNKITTQKDKISSVKKSVRYDNFSLSTYAMFQLSRLYFDTGRTDLSEKTLLEIIQKNRSFGPAYRLLGNIYSMNGDTVLSKWNSERASDLISFSPPVDTLVDKLVLLSRSELYLLKKIDEAELSIYSDWTLKLINNALQYMPDNKFLVSKAVRIYLWKNLDQQATALIDQHIGYYIENYNEMNKVGLLFYQKGLYPQAMKYWTVAVNLELENAENHKNIALCNWGMGDKQKSQEILNNLIEKNWNNPKVLADITYLLFHLREKEQAMGYLPRLKQLVPTNPILQKMLGEIAESKGDFVEAIIKYENSFRGDPEDLTTIKYLGNLLLKLGMWDKYISHYREALKYHPNDPELMERLGTLLIKCPDPSLRKISEGKDYSERAFIHVASRPNILVSSGASLAFAYALLGEKQNAISTLRQAINIARRANLSSTYQAELEKLLETIEKIEN